MNKYLNLLERYLLYAVLFLVPIFYLPLFSDAFGLPKLLVLGIGVGLLLIVKAIKVLVARKVEIASGDFDLPLLVLVGSYIVSSIFTASNKMEAFLLPGNASVLIGAFLLYFFLNNLNLTQKNILKVVLFASGLVVAIVSVLSTSSIISGLKAGLVGGNLPQAIFLTVSLIICVEMVLELKDFAKKVFFIVGGVIITLSLALSVAAMLPGKPDALALPSFQTSYAIALDTLKESPLFGAGPGNYLSAFNRFRPVEYNATNFWQIRFTTASDFYLTIVTEAGLFGLAGIILVLIAIIKSSRKFKPNLALAATVVLLAVFPANIVLVVTLFVLLSLSAATKKQEISLPSHLPAIPYIIALPVIVLVGVFFFFSYTAVKAEAIFKNSLDALVKGDAKQTYDLMRTAIILNPYADRYHAAYAQTNMAIAESLAQKKDIKDTDRQTISTLIQQAIREGKSTVLLNPTRSGNWELLARIYQAIIPFAQGADQFALQTYSQAIALDPINPNLRITLGGVYYSLGQYDNAIDVFKLAVAAKPDLANSHFNLSAAYRQKGEYDNAIAEMNNVLSLVAKDSPDYKTAQTELDNLKKKAPAKPSTTTGELTAPQKAQPVITPPLNLPQEATPPATQP